MGMPYFTITLGGNDGRVVGQAVGLRDAVTLARQWFRRMRSMSQSGRVLPVEVRRVVRLRGMRYDTEWLMCTVTEQGVSGI